MFKICVLRTVECIISPDKVIPGYFYTLNGIMYKVNKDTIELVRHAMITKPEGFKLLTLALTTNKEKIEVNDLIVPTTDKIPNLIWRVKPSISEGKAWLQAHQNTSVEITSIDTLVKLDTNNFDKVLVLRRHIPNQFAKAFINKQYKEGDVLFIKVDPETQKPILTKRNSVIIKRYVVKK